MDIWRLRVFCKVVELKSFSRAGQAIHLSQPTVSSHIKDLEDHFGCQLIDRLSREAVPTKAGRLLHTYAKRIISLQSEAESAMAEFRGSVKGVLEIGGSTIPGAFVLPARIGGFTSQFPDVSVRLTIGDTRQIIDLILSGDLEIGVVGAVSDNAAIFQKKLVEDEMCLVVPADHPWAGRNEIMPDELFSETFIIRESGSGTLKSIQSSFADAGLNFSQLKVAARIGSTEAIRQGIRNRMGVSILSAIAVSDDVAAGHLKTLSITGLALKRAFYITHHKKRALSPMSRMFVAFVQDSQDGDPASANLTQNGETVHDAYTPDGCGPEGHCHPPDENRGAKGKHRAGNACPTNRRRHGDSPGQ